MDGYDPVTDEQLRAIKTQALATIRDGYVVRGYSPERIRTLMIQAESNLLENMARMQASYPNWLTPRRQRILAEIR